MNEDIRNADTIEVLSPLHRKRRRRRRVQATFVGLVAALGAAVLAATFTLGASPHLREALAASRPGTRLLHVASTPKGADVFLNETHLGETPVHDRVEPGSYTLRVVHRGYRAWRQPVDVLTETHLRVTLEPLELATLIVESEPEDAQVLLNGEHRGTTPLTLEHIGAGTYTVEVRKPRHLPVVQEVELEAGETRRLAVALKSDLERYYREAIAEQPKKLSNYTELLHVHTLKGDAEKALDVAHQALAILSEAEATPTELRQFADELGKITGGQVGALDEEAEAKVIDGLLLVLEKMILASPGETSQYEPVVAQLGKLGQFSRIQALCQKLAENPEVGVRAYTYIARMFLGWGESACAIRLLSRAVKEKPNYFYARRYLASAYHRTGQLDEALEHYLAAEKLAANTRPYYQGLVHVGIARVRAARNEVEEAAARYQKALALDNVPTTYTCQWRFLYAQLLAQHGRTDEAMDQYRQIEEDAPNARTRALARKARKSLRTRQPASKQKETEKK